MLISVNLVALFTKVLENVASKVQTHTDKYVYNYLVFIPPYKRASTDKPGPAIAEHVSRVACHQLEGGQSAGHPHHLSHGTSGPRSP